jgi:hypothetical protein
LSEIDVKGGMIAIVKTALLLVVAARAALPCEIDTPSVKEALKRAEIVFRGSITEVRDSEIIFRVQRVWKGHVPPVFAMPKIISTAPCMAGFFENRVKVGAELLVYARRVPQISGTGYVAGAASRTALIEDATEDLRRLGRGRPPTICAVRTSGRTQ